MAIVPTRVVATNPAEILAENPHGADSGDYRTTRHFLKNTTGTASIFLGGNGVTDVDGFEWEPEDGPVEVELEPGEILYGYATATQDVHSLNGGR